MGLTKALYLASWELTKKWTLRVRNWGQAYAGLAIMDTLALHDIRYCFLDDFCIGASYTLKTQTLIDAMQKRINAILNGNAQEAMNVRDIMESCLHESWIEMTAREKEAFFNRYLRRMELSVKPDGMVNICIR